MAHKTSKEYELIVNEVIEKVLIKNKEPKKCKYFDALKMAKYIENNMNEKERKNYEKHLFNCDYCFNIYHNIENEIENFYKAKFTPLMDRMLQKAFDVLNNELHKKIKEDGITLKLLKKGFEVISIHKINNIFPQYLPAVRDKKEDILISLKIEKKINNMKFYITLEHQSKEYITIKIFSEGEINSDKKRFIKLISSNGEIRREFSKEVIIKDVIKDNYKIFIDKLKIINLNME